MPNNDVRTIAVDSNGTIWLDVVEGGLTKFDGTNWTEYTAYDYGLPSDIIHSIAIDRNGNKWIGTIYGLAEFDGIKSDSL